jgi:hypothetical protein
VAKKGNSSTPPPPDPVVTAKAQSDANIATAQEQQRLNMIGTVGPQGSTGYRVDDSQPGGYVQYTNLSPQEQASYDLSKQAENAALGVAGQQIGRVGEALDRRLDLSTLPGMQTGVGAQQMQTAFNMGGPLQYGFDPGQQVQGQVGGDLEAARRNAEQAVYSQATSRLDPRFSRQEQSLDVKLANQGLSENSAAAQNARDAFGRERTDAYNQAAYSSIAAGEQAAQGQFGRQLGQGQFANQAAGQMYQQNMGQAAFNNQTAGQDYGQNLGAAQFGNQARQAQFQQDMSAAQFANQARQQALQEQAYVQNEPLNQFNALMSSSQVGMPQGIQYTPSQVANTDVLGAYALQQQAQQANAARSAQQQSGLMSGLMSLGSAAIMASDVRVKTDLERVGELKPGIGLYSFRYLWGGGRRVGVMAQEVAMVRPEAVTVGAGGMLGVDYGRL